MSSFFKRFIFSFLAIFFAMCMAAQTVSLEQVWIDHNVYHNGQKGMRIHCKFTVRHYKDRSCRLCLMHYIEYSDGRELWGNSQYYTTTDRHGNPQATAMCGFDITPEWEHTTYNDWYVFMPYSALHINNGNADLRVATLAVNESNNVWCADKIVYTPFTYSSGNNTPPQNNRNSSNNTCTMCGGITAIACTRCGGRGQVYTTYGWTTCNQCQGVGNITCPSCHGSGKAN